LDILLREALKPYAQVEAPEGLWSRIAQKTQFTPPPRWHKLFSWLYGSTKSCFSFYNQPYCIDLYGKYIPSPFASVMVKQMLDLRLIS